MLSRVCVIATVALFGATATMVQAAAPTAAEAPAAPVPVAPAPGAPDSLAVYFGPASAALSPQALAVLDQAARTYRDGRPIIMVVSGGADSTGAAAGNLHLSQMRADNVLQGLVARGIPVERFQVLAKGETEPAVPAPGGTSEARNRRVDISWR